jgi:translation initiation factor 1
MKNHPFGDLRKQLGLPESGGAKPPDSTDDAAKPPRTHGPGKVVVRMERSDRGGKEATMVEQLGLAPPELDVWLKDLKAALGCGGSIEGDALMLQGDHRKRLAALLTQRGVRKVVIG